MKGFAHRNNPDRFIRILKTKAMSISQHLDRTHLFWTDWIGTFVASRSVSPEGENDERRQITVYHLHMIVMQTEEVLVLVGDERNTIQTERTFRTFETTQMIRVTQSL